MMAAIYPTIENIQSLKVKPTDGEWSLVQYLVEELDETYEVFFTPYLDGDRPDIIILKQGCGAFIIEVKDWNLDHYSVTKNNKWKVKTSTSSSVIASPQSQAFRYKKNLYDLHLPLVGLARLTNPNFYNLVHCYVYFHGARQHDIKSMYEHAEVQNKQEQTRQNQLFQNKKIRFDKYDKTNNSLRRKSSNLQRDKFISIGNDNLNILIKKVKQSSTHVLFDDRVYDDFKRRLSPPEHTLKQGKKINLDQKQLKLSTSVEGKEKIKGIAGCGKTTILAQRAINAYKRHSSTVLLLTFNITLKNYIRDKISDILGKRDFHNFEISNYHQFFIAQLNNNGLDIEELLKQSDFDKLFSTDVFKDIETIKYQSIILDEVQDYEPEWVKIIRDNFLAVNGEMVLLGDESQNVYQRDNQRSAVIAQGFGTWKKLNRSYRIGMDSSLNQVFKDFQERFLIEKYSDTEVFDTKHVQLGMSFNLLKYYQLSPHEGNDEASVLIRKHISEHNLHPNDIVILSSKINAIRRLNELISENESTHCMFETYAELSQLAGVEIDSLKNFDDQRLNDLVKKNKKIIEDARRVKKNHFYANSGLIKLSTTHSFKGLESKTVFYIMHEDDLPEIVYTSITRSTENLVIFDVSDKNKYSEFFMSCIN
jgi:hypothetical protein